MNVTLYSIEVSKRKWSLKGLFQNSETRNIRECVSAALKSDSSDSAGYEAAARSKWDEEFETLRIVRPSRLVLGHFIKRNVKVFVFEQAEPGLTSTSEVTLNIIAISAADIEQIFEISFSKLKKVFVRYRTDLLIASHLFVFPFNSHDNDIYDQNLKIKAVFTDRPFLESRERIKFAFVLFLGVASALYIQAGSSGSLQSSAVQYYFGIVPLDSQIFVRSILTACLLYVILDLIPLRLLPRFFEKGGYQIKIQDLSSFVETKEQSLITNIMATATPAPLSPPPEVRP